MWSKLFGSFLAANIVTDRFTFIKIVFHTTVAHHPGITKETVGGDDSVHGFHWGLPEDLHKAEVSIKTIEVAILKQDSLTACRWHRFDWLANPTVGCAGSSGH